MVRVLSLTVGKLLHLSHKRVLIVFEVLLQELVFSFKYITPMGIVCLKAGLIKS